MARQQSYEQSLLSPIKEFINENASNNNEKLYLLEHTASLYSGADLKIIYDRLKLSTCIYEGHEEISQKLLEMICTINIPPEFIFSSLSTELISVNEQKENGVFYTDYRLALYLAESLDGCLKKDSKVCDLSAGTGMLLIAVARKYRELYPENYSTWLSSKVVAYDLSEYALRGAFIGFLSMTDDSEALIALFSKWKVCDSLLELHSKVKYDIIIGNPPWKKVKISRPQYISSIHSDVIYGSQYPVINEELFSDAKKESARYCEELRERYPLLPAEPDLFVAFLEAAITKLKMRGHMVYIVPAALIRSIGTFKIREHLIKNASQLSIVLFDNRERYFDIDTRFKFIVVQFTKKKTVARPTKTIRFSYYQKPKYLSLNEPVTMAVSDLEKMSPILTIPEVRNKVEFSLFKKIMTNGEEWGMTDNSWKVSICREVDMTNDKALFTPNSGDSNLPLIEGRMVQQYRFGAKAYVCGEGRSAKWEPEYGGRIRPQYYVKSTRLEEELLSRIKRERVGFCDIAGQTNERSLMASIIPKNVVCGNKVPTLLFPLDDTGKCHLFWLGVVNSFVFDWMIRRVITTTVNYFLLFSVPLPRIDLNSNDYDYICSRVKQIQYMGSEYYKSNKMAILRAQIEAKVAILYGLNDVDLRIIFEDFNLVDKKQIPINSEKKSTCTQDAVLSAYYDLCGLENQVKKRVNEQKKIGNRPFIPSEMVDEV